MTLPSRLQALGLLCATTVGAFLLAGLVAALREKGLGSGETAGWIQAIGATLGLAIAIWVPVKQKYDAVEAEESGRKESALRVCLAFRDELSLLAGRFTGSNITELLREAPGEVFDREIPIPRQRFPVFNAMVGRLTEIDDANIRQGIIEAYEAATSLIDVAEMNNRKLLELREIVRSHNAQEGNIDHDDFEHRKAILVTMRLQMQFICRLTITKTNAVLAMLDAAVATAN
jgi:hypothetical protein